MKATKSKISRLPERKDSGLTRKGPSDDQSNRGGYGDGLSQTLLVWVETQITPNDIFRRLLDVSVVHTVSRKSGFLCFQYAQWTHG